MGLDELFEEPIKPSPATVLVADDFFDTPLMQEVARLTHPDDPDGRFVFDFFTNAEAVIEQLQRHKLNNVHPLGIVLDSLGQNPELPGAFNFEKIIKFMMENGLDIPVCVISTDIVSVDNLVYQVRQRYPQLRIMFMEKGGSRHISLIKDPIEAFANVHSLLEDSTR